MRFTRRDVLLSGVFGAGALGLRALSTGLPAVLLQDPGTRPAPVRIAKEGEDADDGAQYLVLSTSSAGDPVNANVPGTYEFPDIVHSGDPRMRKTALSLGGRSFFAAAPWATLPQAVLDRTCFFHHATLTSGHPGIPKVLGLPGPCAEPEMAPSLAAKHLASRLQTLQTAPVVLGTDTLLTFEGQRLPRLRATSLREQLTTGRGQALLGRLPALRDETLDRIHAQLRERGSEEAQALRTQLDRRALSRSEAQALADRLLSDLSSIRSDDAEGQAIAAAVLIRLNVAPVLAMNIGFGGDNHFDHGLRAEAEQTVQGVAHIAALQRRLAAYGLADRVTFAMINVFGRTLKRHGNNGRDHWARHHTTVLIGAPFRGGVVGGLEPHGDDYAAQALDSRSGRGDRDGDIPFAETLAAMGRTLGRGLGVPEAVLASSFRGGKVVGSALSRDA